MKNFALLLFAIFTNSFCSSQILTMDKVPAASANAFKQKFPNASQPRWSQENVNVYEVQFFNGKKRQSSLFDNTGKWLQTQTEINYNAVPMKVQNSFAKEFEGYQIQEVYETEMPDTGITYEIIAFRGTKNFATFFSIKGELLKKEEGRSEE